MKEKFDAELVSISDVVMRCEYAPTVFEVLFSTGKDRLAVYAAAIGCG